MINQYQGELLDIHLGSNRDLAALRVAHDNIMKLKNSPAVVPISTVAPATTITRPAATSNTETAGTNQPTVTDNHSSAVTEHEEILTSNPHKPPEKQKQKRSDKMKLDYSVKHLVDDKGIAITGTKFDKEIQNILAENSDSVSKKVASIRELQSKLGVTPDGDFGPKSQATLLNTKKETTDVGAPAIVASAPIAVASAPAKAPDRTASVPTQPASATDTPTKPAIATSAPIAAASNPKTQQTPAEKTTPKKSNEPDNGVNGWAVAA